MKNTLSVICDFSNLSDISFHLVVNNNSDDPILVNKRGCYCESFLTQYTNMSYLLDTLKVFSKVQSWFACSLTDENDHYPMLTFINEFKLRGFDFVFFFCNVEVTDVNNITQYAQANHSLAVIEEILKLKKL